MPENIQAFMAEVFASTESAVLEGFRKRGPIIMELIPQEQRVIIGGLVSIAKGGGFASTTLDWLVTLARKHDVLLVGQIARLGELGLTVKQLTAWYRRHGFSVDREGFMYLKKAVDKA